MFFRHVRLPATMKDVSNGALTVASITTGFLIATLSTLFALQRSDRTFRLARQMGGYRLLVEYLISGSRWNFAAAVLSVFALFFDLQWNPSWLPYAFAVWLLVVSIAVCTIIRVSTILALVLRAVSSPEE